jgi:hypothetical protein
VRDALVTQQILVNENTKYWSSMYVRLALRSGTQIHHHRFGHVGKPRGSVWAAQNASVKKDALFCMACECWCAGGGRLNFRAQQELAR